MLMASSIDAFAHTLGSSAVAADILAHDWAGSAFGPLGDWPRWLKSALALVLRSPTPMALLCGPDGRLLYNDGYRVVVGAMHPAVLGASVHAAWPEAAAFNGDVIARVLAGESLSYRDRRFMLGAPCALAERWFNLDYSPLFDDDGAPRAVLAVVVEQTDQHRANAALRESQQRLDHAQAAGQVGTFTVELASGTVFTTRGFNQLFGLPDAPSIDLATIEAMVVTSDGVLPSTGASRGDQGAPLQVEYRIRRHDDGVERWIMRRAEFERNKDGVAGRIVGLVQDITERKAAELALAESAARFQALTQALPNLVWTATPDGLVDWMNARVADYSGMAPAALAGLGWLGLVHEDDVEDAGRMWRNCVASGAFYETEYRVRRADGQYRWHLVRAFPQRIPGGSITRWIGTSTDIDERKRLETHSKRAFSRVWRLSQELMLVCDFAGAIAAVNPSATRLLGWTEDQLVGRLISDFIHPDDLASTAAEVGKLSEGVTTLAFENRYLASDGSYRLLDWTAVPDNGMIHAVGRDVTRERGAEEALRQSQKLEAIGMLTGGVAHDFNNVLAVVRTSIDLLRLVPLDVERRKRYMDAISDAVTRAARLTGQLLAFARRQSLQPEVFDAGRNVQMVSEMIGSLTGARIRMDVSLADTGCFVDADPSQFDTAIVNLAVNARDAMDGSGRLAISVREADEIPAVRGQQAVSGAFVAVAVADTGKGIPPELLTQIFEPFFTTKSSGHGTGLGLSQVFGFAKQSGGEITVESTVGAGTTFTLFLPRAASPVAEPAPKPRNNGIARGAGKCILVVEDNDDVGAIVRHSLEELGYTTVMTTSAEQALVELDLDAGRFAAIFSDVVMNGMGGFALGQEVRRRFPALPFVLSSGYSSVLASEQRHGFKLLPKPYSLEELAQTLADALAGVAPASATAAPSMPPAAASLEGDQELFRLAELDGLQILDTPPEETFDELTRAAAAAMGVPIAMISLVDDRRQWFKSKVGVEATETARETAFCAHAIRTPDDVMQVPDATQDPRFSSNPFVTGDPHIRFYAGAPLVTAAGHALGTLCVVDSKPRTLSAGEVAQLRTLAAQVVMHIEGRGRDAGKMTP
jgi:PAS domain S-box-containing protein